MRTLKKQGLHMRQTVIILFADELLAEGGRLLLPYDEAAPLFNMIMDCEPVTFSSWWKTVADRTLKGQYGITTGGEIGAYNTEREDIEDDKFKGTFYENISDDERLGLSLS